MWQRILESLRRSGRGEEEIAVLSSAYDRPRPILEHDRPKFCQWLPDIHAEKATSAEVKGWVWNCPVRRLKVIDMPSGEPLPGGGKQRARRGAFEGRLGKGSINFVAT